MGPEWLDSTKPATVNESCSMALVFVILQNGEPPPAPIHFVVLDQPVVIQFHDFDKIHLLAVAGSARILENKFLLAVCEISRAVVLAKRRLSSGDCLKKRPHLFMSAAYPFFLTHKVRYERTFNHGVPRVQLERSLGIVFRESPIPIEIDAFQLALS